MLQKIINLCKEQGKSITELENACKLGTRSIYRWDENKPAVDKVQRVAKFLSTTVDELLKEDA